MSEFAYKAINQDGTESFGIVEAENQKEALTKIGKAGLVVTDMHPAHASDRIRLKWQSSREHEQQEARNRHKRQLLGARYLDGRMEYGICYRLNPRENVFRLEIVDEQGKSTGESREVAFKDLKALFTVRSVDGKYDPPDQPQYRDDTAQEIFIEFRDGEVLNGFVQHYNPEAPRFVVVLKDQTTNNKSALVERSAVHAVYTPRQYMEKQGQRRSRAVKAEPSVDLSQDETMGDFYFESKSYESALEYFENAYRKHPESVRLRRKTMAARYNIGIHHMRAQNYSKALEVMERVLKAEPRNEHTKKKVSQLRRLVQKERGKK